MKSKYISPFKPKQIKDFNPKNMQIYTFKVQIQRKILINPIIPINPYYSLLIPIEAL